MPKQKHHYWRYGLIITILLGGCAGWAPVPGGTDTVNRDFYKSKEDFMDKVGQLTPGMSPPQVFTILGRKEEEFTKLKREEIMEAMLGTNNAAIQDGIQNQQMRMILQYLYGYRLEFKAVKREHGFDNPIRWRTNESGFDYAISLIFYNGQLLEKPVISGGKVNSTSSKTLFDFLSLGTAARNAMP